MHVDEFIERDKHHYAAWVFNHFRLPAILKMRFAPFMAKYKLFCTYAETRYRVTGASRFGDIWLAEDFNEDTSYDLRVDVGACSNWSSTPECVGVQGPVTRGSADSTLDMQALDVDGDEQ